MGSLNEWAGGCTDGWGYRSAGWIYFMSTFILFFISLYASALSYGVSPVGRNGGESSLGL